MYVCWSSYLCISYVLTILWNSFKIPPASTASCLRVWTGRWESESLPRYLYKHKKRGFSRSCETNGPQLTTVVVVVPSHTRKLFRQATTAVGASQNYVHAVFVSIPVGLPIDSLTGFVLCVWLLNPELSRSNYSAMIDCRNWLYDNVSAFWLGTKPFEGDKSLCPERSFLINAWSLYSLLDTIV